MKKIGRIFLLFILLFTTFDFGYYAKISLANSSSLPNSFHSVSNGYGSKMTPTTVPNYIRNLDLDRSTEANKGGSDLNKRLVYDIYTGNSSHSQKGGFKVETANMGDGRQEYITFTGWSALYLHHHHTPYNQETYIRARNVKTGENKTFLTQQTSLSAYNDLRAYGYPRCPDNAYNRRSTQDSNACNFDYQWTSFKAWIPLQELFPAGTRHEEWELYLIKVVGYSSNYRNNNVVWERLRLPFDIGEINYNGGKITLSSEYQSSDRMVMISRNVLRRAEPRGSTYLNPRYFTTGRQYIFANVHDDGNETANWYRVNHSSEGRAWGASPHFQFTGQQARLSFNMGTKTCPDGSTKYVDENCTVNITVLHVDTDTGKTLERETFNRKVGTNYSFSPKKDGYFKDSNGNPYIAYPSNQSYSGRVNNSNFTITFHYRVPVESPEQIKELNNSTEGMAQGQFRWFLEKDSSNTNLLSENGWKIGRGDGRFNNATFNIGNGTVEIIDNGNNNGAMVTQTIFMKANTPYKVNFETEYSDGMMYLYERGTGTTAHSTVRNGDVFQLTGEDRFIDVALYKTLSAERILYKNVTLTEQWSDDGNGESRLRLINNLSINGTHFDTRNVRYSISSEDVIYEESDIPINVYLSDPNAIKDLDIEYEFSYEYTNHYKEVYDCVAKQGNYCFEWKFVKTEPVWDSEYVQKATWKHTHTANHNYGQTFIFEPESINDIELIIGQETEINGNESSTKTNKTLKEKFSVNPNRSTTLLTQTWLPIYEEINYSNNTDNTLHFTEETKMYFPHDVDEHLQEKYRNHTEFHFSNYMIPLRVENKTNSKLEFKTADDFYVTKKEGFAFSTPHNSSISEIEEKAETDYETLVGGTYDDEVLISEDGSRYYFNINGNSDDQPNTWYNHTFLFGKLGYSDVTLQLNKRVQFEKYLVGSAIDDPLINEQPDTVIKDIEYPESNSIILTSNQQLEIRELAKSRSPLIHGFRSTDIKEMLEQLKTLIPSLAVN